jgi:putative protease
MKKVELLAPCGSLDSLHAAVQNGADAVYLGGSRFSARAYASNFDDENMIYAVNYCHAYGVKIYITVNTLIKDSEMKDVLSYIKFLYEIGVDALIVQDAGLVYLIRQNFPDFELHASTQMTIHNGDGAKFFKNLGFSRIVLSRELSLNEIQYISKDLNIETEIFVHGALCICYSGQCLMSSLIGGRSGNRGRCAQPCRLSYDLIDEMGKTRFKGYALSPKDICTLQDVPNIINSKASSLKIEGRMKRPEYVAGVVSIYRKAIDYAYEKKEFDYEKETKKLLQLFNREGFSKAYMYGNAGKDMMAYKFPKNMGIYLGEVGKDLSIKLNEDIKLNDGIRVGEGGFTVSKIIKDSLEVTNAKAEDVVKLMPSEYSYNDKLYKTSDVELLESLGQSYSNMYGRKMDIDIKCSFKLGEPFELSCIYKGNEFKVKGEIIQKAIKKPLEAEKISENLVKTGNTPFNIANIEFISFEQGFLPISAINNIRRELINSILQWIHENNKRTTSKALDFNRTKKQDITMEKLIVSVYNNEQLQTCKELGVKAVIVNFFNRKCDISIDRINSMDLYLKIPNIIKDEFDFICRFIDENISNIRGIVTANAGIISKFEDKTDIIGDYKLNIFNKYSLDFYNYILKGTFLSVEINRREIIEIVKNSPLPCGVIIYGKLETMVSEYCPIGSILGGKNSEHNCKKECIRGEYKLKDRKGEEFLVRTDNYCRSHIYNSMPINLLDNIKDLSSIGNIAFRMDFVDEDKEEVKDILNSYKAGKNLSDEKFTRGHYKRGVE